MARLGLASVTKEIEDLDMNCCKLTGRHAPERSAGELVQYKSSPCAAEDAKKATSVEFAAELPKSPVGKVLRRVLREPYWQ